MFFNYEVMVKSEEQVVIRAIAICFKPFLKPEEALIYCNLGRTQFAKKCADFNVFKSNSGYFKKEELDKMLSGIKNETALLKDKKISRY